MQGRKANLLLRPGLLRPGTGQGLLAVGRADASLHPQPLPGAQRPPGAPVVAGQRRFI